MDKDEGRITEEDADFVPTLLLIWADDVIFRLLVDKDAKEQCKLLILHPGVMGTGELLGIPKKMLGGNLALD